MQNILIVCIGNICRSPVAEALFKAALPEKNIWSAGIAALEGHPADQTAQEIALQHGLDLSTHRAQQLSSYMCLQADLILVMEKKHQRNLVHKYPLIQGKVHCLGSTGSDRHIDIPDPYKKDRDAFLTSHRLIKESVEHWVRLIKQLS